MFNPTNENSGQVAAQADARVKNEGAPQAVAAKAAVQHHHAFARNEVGVAKAVAMSISAKSAPAPEAAAMKMNGAPAKANARPSSEEDVAVAALEERAEEKELAAEEAVVTEVAAAVPADEVSKDVQLTDGLAVVRIARPNVPAKEPTDDATDLGISGGNGLLYGLLGLLVVGGGVAVLAGGKKNGIPTAADDAFTAAEGAGTVSFSVAANDSDPDRDTLTFSANGALPEGVTFSPQGQVQVNASLAAFDVLPAGATRNLTFSYTVNDGRGGSDTANVTITITGVNDAPVAAADVAVATEDGMVVTGNVGTNDRDVDTGAVLTYSLNAPVAGLTLNPNGTYSFDPSNAAYQNLAMGETRNVVANYTVTDDRGATATSTLTITVTGVNDAPVAVADVAAATEDGMVVTGNVGANDRDADAGARLTYSLNAPVAGLVLNADGSYRFDPSNAAYQNLAMGETRNVVANYTVTDDRGATSVSTLTITVTGVNDAPVAVADVARATEDGMVVTGNVGANDTDADAGARLSYALNAPVAGLVLNADGSYRFDPSNAAYQNLAMGETRDVVANYTVTDDRGATSVSTLTITVTGVNDAPVAMAATATATEDGARVMGRAVATDVDAGAVLTYRLDAPIEGVTLNADGSFVFDPSNMADQELAQGQVRDVIANYTVTDQFGATSSSTITVTVTGVNDRPVAMADVAVATEDGMVVTGNVGANDRDVDLGAVLTYSLNAPVAGLTLNPNGTYSFDPSNAAYQSLAMGQTRDVVANYTVTDEFGATSTSTLTITVTGVNDAPVITSGATATVVENAAVTTIVYDANATDVDMGDTVRFSLTGADAGLFTIDATTGEVRLIAPANFERRSSLSFTVVATDSAMPAGTASRDVVLTVTDAVDVLSLDVGTVDAPVTIDAGIQAGDVRDTNFGFAETSGAQSEVRIVNFGANDFIQFSGSPSDYTFQNDGLGNLILSSVDDVTGAVNVITLVGVGIAANAIIVNAAQADAALDAVLGAGDYFRGTAAPAVTIPTTGNQVIDASGRAAMIVEDLGGPESVTRINNFGADDVLSFINGLRAEVGFSTDPDDARDLRIEYVDPNTGNVSTVVIDNVLRADGPIVFDEASAEAAVALVIGAGDYFQFA